MVLNMLTSKIYSFKLATLKCILLYTIWLLFLKENQSKFNILNFECFAVIFQEVITVSIFLAQQITTKTDCFAKLGPVLRSSIKILSIRMKSSSNYKHSKAWHEAAKG